jgi:hypothetical protein
MSLVFTRKPDSIWGRLTKLRLPSLMVDKKSGSVVLENCALSLLVAFYLAYRNRTYRLRQRYRKYPVPAHEWSIPFIEVSREWLSAKTGYCNAQVSKGLSWLIEAGYIARQDVLESDTRDDNNRFTVTRYTLLNPSTECPLEPVDPTVGDDRSYAYQDILHLNRLHYFSLPLCIVQPSKRGDPSVFATMTPSEKRL